MDTSDFVTFWGSNKLKRWSQAVVDSTAMPEASKRFLVEVGLPADVDWTLQFDAAGSQLPSLPGMPSRRRFALDDVVPICIEEPSGVVVADESVVGGGTRFVNASVERFAECLLYYQQYRIAVRPLSDEKAIQKLIKETRKHLRAVDPSGLDDDQKWWPVIVEQMVQGLL